MKRWIKVPGPGEMRGEGEWVQVGTYYGADEDWQYLITTGYLPIYEGDDEPDDETAKAWREARSGA